VTAGTQTDPDFAFAGLATPEAEAAEANNAPAAGPDPLGALAGLLGTWKGHGFNAIWRPHHPANQQDRFLELNKTDETLVFTRINGPIPNRGLAMADIDMFGLTYMQQISESSTGAGLHIEPGIWATVPPTTDPSEPASVVRLVLAMVTAPRGHRRLLGIVSDTLERASRPHVVCMVEGGIAVLLMTRDAADLIDVLDHALHGVGKVVIGLLAPQRVVGGGRPRAGRASAHAARPHLPGGGAHGVVARCG
jgi:hypothetical protein